jgi:uncharacterized protein (TIGR00251 family)
VSGATALRLAPSGSDLLVPVRARPRGRRDALVGVRDGALLVETTAAPQDGAANEAIRRTLAQTFGVARGDVELTSGASSRQKRFRVARLDLATALARIEPLLERSAAAAAKERP